MGVYAFLRYPFGFWVSLYFDTYPKALPNEMLQQFARWHWSPSSTEKFPFGIGICVCCQQGYLFLAWDVRQEGADEMEALRIEVAEKDALLARATQAGP